MRVSARSRIPFALAIAISLVVAGCSADSSSGDDTAAGSSPESASDATDTENEDAYEPAPGEGDAGAREDHARSEGGDEHREGVEHDGEGEESGVYIDTRETWDAVRRGVRLVLKFYPDRGVFFGSVENTTKAMVCAVRAEVHLDSGIELGPTEATDLEAGQQLEVVLPTEDAAFETWTAHPEISSCAG